jgi:hypothetical protein
MTVSGPAAYRQASLRVPSLEHDPESVQRFSGKIMLKQRAEARW